MSIESIAIKKQIINVYDIKFESRPLSYYGIQAAKLTHKFLCSVWIAPFCIATTYFFRGDSNKDKAITAFFRGWALASLLKLCSSIKCIGIGNIIN